MYEQHFGLTKRPFQAEATGRDVFVGPQTAGTMAGIKKALQSRDAVVVVSGPAGSGKSILVGKALDALGDTNRTVRLGRVSLKGTDVLEFLLDQLGVEDIPSGPIRQFAALRAALAQLETEGASLVITVEDAARCGVDTIAELEALTAADAGESGGAALVLMGDDSLASFLAEAPLARLVQRVRQRHTITPLSVAEMRGYLLHRFRQAGGDFGVSFDPQSASVVHALSGGIPRVANNILEASLAAAAASGEKPVSAATIAAVASEEFGLEAELPARVESPAVVAPADAPAPAPAPVEEAGAPPTADAATEAGGADAEPVIVFADEEAEEEPLEDLADLAGLIDATLPQLEALEAEPVEPVPVSTFDAQPETVIEIAPDVQAKPGAEAIDKPAPEPASEPAVEAPAPEPVPPRVAETAPASAAESTPEDVPEWEREPTLEQLKPDLDALEKAMAIAHGEAPDPGTEDVPILNADDAHASTGVEEIPEITLDFAIRQQIDDNLIDEPDAVSAPAAPEPAAAGAIPEPRPRPQASRKADDQLDRIAAELAKAKTIEDVDDRLAETLFGESFNMVAAQVAAAQPANDEAPDGTESSIATPPLSETEASVETPPPAEEAPALDATAFEENAVEVSLETPSQVAPTGMDASASQRMRTLRALNADRQASVAEADKQVSRVPESPAADVPVLEPIEDQINTSMTETLKALNIPPPVSSNGDGTDDEADEKTGGFFSRFRRS